MRYIFFAPLPPLFPLLTTPEKGRNCPFPYPRNLTLTCSDAPAPLPSLALFFASLIYTLYIGAH